MIVYFALYVLICLVGMKIAIKPAKGNLTDKKILPFIFDNERTWFDSMSREKTEAIKGIFVIMVFFSHFCNCYKFNSESLDFFVKKIVGTYFGQLMVVVFLFYSGYGIMESYKKKGKSYAVNMPIQRILKLLFDFDVAVLIYLLINFLFGKKFSAIHIIKSLLAWKNVGNSDWYIFAILALYSISFVAFVIAGKKQKLAAGIVTVLSVLYIVVIQKYKEPWWYNTVLCYALGMWYSLFREKFDRIVQRNNITWLACTVLLFAALYATKFLTSQNKGFYLLHALVFAMLIVVVTMKVSFDNAVLRKMGKYVFGVYILQKIPITIMYKTNTINDHIYLNFIIAFAVTIVLAIGYNRFMSLSSKLFKKSRNKS